jgi:hypothetical protein
MLHCLRPFGSGPVGSAARVLPADRLLPGHLFIATPSEVSLWNEGSSRRIARLPTDAWIIAVELVTASEVVLVDALGQVTHYNVESMHRTEQPDTT